MTDGVQRDVSGFATPPPAKRANTPTQPVKPPPRRQRATATETPTTGAVRTRPRQTSSQQKVASGPVRVSVTVPTELAEQLRTATEERSATQAEIVFDAQIELGDQLEAEIREQTARRGVPPRTRRRRGGGPATQLGLSMTPAEAEAMREAAERCHHTVAAHVTQLLTRYLS